MARDGQKQAQWPLTANTDNDAGAIYFLVSNRDGKYDALEEFPAVTVRAVPWANRASGAI